MDTRTGRILPEENVEMKHNTQISGDSPLNVLVGEATNKEA